jgi:hypothetical protein
MPNWQNDALCVVLVSDKKRKKVEKQFPNCELISCPYTESDKYLDLHEF